MAIGAGAVVHPLPASPYAPEAARIRAGHLVR